MEPFEKCGKELKIGDWPYCPHERMTHFGEKPMSPHYDEHICTDGTEFRTWGEKVRYMDKHAIVPKKQPKVGSLFYDMHKG